MSVVDGWDTDEALRGPHAPEDRTPPPGQQAVVMAALMLGLLLMGIQLWLRTIALELYLAGEGRQVWQRALISGAIFLGGLAMVGLLRRRPRVRRVTPTEGGLVTLLRVPRRRP